MTIQDNIMARVKKCDDLLKEGHTKRSALAESGCHSTTYDKYIDTINRMTPEELSHLEDIYHKDTRTRKQKVELPNTDKKCKILITLDKKYFDILANEANEQEIYHVSIVARKYLISGLKQAYGIK